MTENVKKEIVCEASHCVPLVGGCLHFKEPATKIHSLLMRSKEENNLIRVKCESIPLPLDLAAARCEACNGSHKLREEQCTGYAGGGGGAARGVQ